MNAVENLVNPLRAPLDELRAIRHRLEIGEKEINVLDTICGGCVLNSFLKRTRSLSVGENLVNLGMGKDVVLLVLVVVLILVTLEDVVVHISSFQRVIA